MPSFDTIFDCTIYLIWVISWFKSIRKVRKASERFIIFVTLESINKICYLQHICTFWLVSIGFFNSECLPNNWNGCFDGGYGLWDRHRPMYTH